MNVNSEPERAVIGGILLKGDLIAEISLSLQPDDFFLSECREIYKTYLEMFRQNIPIDGATLKTYLPAPEAEDLFLFSVNAAEDLPFLRNVPEYVKIIQDHSMRRKAKEKILDLSEAIDYESPINECQEKASDLLQCFSSPLTRDGSVSAKDGFLSVVESLDEKKAHIKTGISFIDRFIALEPGFFFVIGGRPSSGKTALSLQIASNISDHYQTLYFSLETSPKIVYQRMLSSFTKTPLDQIKRQAVSDNQMNIITNSFAQFEKKKLKVIKASGYSVERIRSEIIREKAEVAIIDYLTLIDCPGKSQYEKATNISIGLHNLAQQTGCVIIVLSQLNRDGEIKPDMTSLRESGQIEQDADAILLIERPDAEDLTKRVLDIVKNKEGEIMYKQFFFDGSIQTFSETETV